ncbi:MAG: HAD hydrolase-like protein [Dehalococcoidales bacterium]|nr:HAD hydrolase-like protein [Dehalococcoidales bacterium]
MTAKQDKKLFLFDIDSTLLRAEGATRKAMLRAFYDIFRAKQSIDTISFHGRTDPELFQEAAVMIQGRRLDDAEYAAMTERYIVLLPEELAKSTFRLMPGVTQLLQHLADEKNTILGLETGNLEASAYLKLKRGDIDHYFSFGGFGSDSEDRTELVRIAIERGRRLNSDNISNKKIFLIGDSPNDVIAGRNAGINTLAVGTGLATKEQLLAESPSYYLNDLSDVDEFMKCVGL